MLRKLRKYPVVTNSAQAPAHASVIQPGITRTASLANSVTPPLELSGSADPVPGSPHTETMRSLMRDQSTTPLNSGGSAGGGPPAHKAACTSNAHIDPVNSSSTTALPPASRPSGTIGGLLLFLLPINLYSWRPPATSPAVNVATAASKCTRCVEKLPC